MRPRDVMLATSVVVSWRVLVAPDLEDLRALAEQGTTLLYALVDGARDSRIVPAIHGGGVESRCLFDGKLDPKLAAVAPYLVALAPGDGFSRVLLAEGWGRAWGVLVAAPMELDDLRRHFRRILKVADEDGRQLLFRYYDPRVLRLYLPTCTGRELDLVFGPVESFFVEHEAGAVERFRNLGGVLIRSQVGEAVS